MATLEKAIALAVEAHIGQTDKANKPYILHPLRVMLSLETETEQIVGILHDVVEDSDLTLKDIRELGYSEEIISALDGVTRREDETYDDFVSRTLTNPISRRVKLADLKDNMNLLRFTEPLSEKDFERLQRYRKAWDRLSFD